MGLSSFLANRTLTAKLVITVSGFFLLGSVLFWLTILKKEQQQLFDSSVNFVSSASKVVKQSLRHDMLAGNMGDVQPILESIVSTEFVEGVRILGTDGRVFYSSEKAEIGTDLGERLCAKCHIQPRGRERRPAEFKQWVIRRNAGHRTLTYVDPLYNEPDCFTAACHVHGRDKKILGLLMTDFSLKALDARIKQQNLNTTFYLIAFISLIAIVLSYILWIVVIKPVTALSEGMEHVSSGDLSRKVPVASKDELGRLAENFNSMTQELDSSRERMKDWAKSLEKEVEKKTAQIQNAQDKLIQAEKLAAVGRLTADIAHEIRNPLTALGGFGRRLQKLASSEKQEAYADIIVSEADRLERILRDVLTFSRETRHNLERLPLAEVVNDAVLLFKEICGDQRIKIELSVASLLPVLIDRDQLREAVNNLLSNAIDAMPDGGLLSVSVSERCLNHVQYVVIDVSDTGPGIPENELSLVYEPFFTTKKVGQGTGLGLSISRKIIEEHGGYIKARNRPEGGLTVSLHLPYQDPENAEIPCWRFMECGRNANSESRCPAFPSFGRSCWAVAGSLCEGKVQGTFAQKLNDCRKCEFYKSVNVKK